MTDKKTTEPVGNSNRLTDNEIKRALECCKSEIESLKADFKRACAERDMRICINNFTESAAIADFAERLKKALYSDSCRLVFDSDLDIFECAIDNLVKEMVGENNA